jgi:hypothetical protein
MQARLNVSSSHLKAGIVFAGYQFSLSTSQGFQPQQEFQAKIKRKLKENWHDLRVLRRLRG